jgi:hypothetical protein
VVQGQKRHAPNAKRNYQRLPVTLNPRLLNFMAHRKNLLNNMVNDRARGRSKIGYRFGEAYFFVSTGAL